MDLRVRVEGEGQVEECLERERWARRVPPVKREPLELQESPAPLAPPESMDLALESPSQGPQASREPAVRQERPVQLVRLDAREVKDFGDPPR